MRAIALFASDLVLIAILITVFVRAKTAFDRLGGDGSDGDGGQRWHWRDQPRPPRMGPHASSGRTQARVPSRPRSRA
jgi:hypothetical protein